MCHCRRRRRVAAIPFHVKAAPLFRDAKSSLALSLSLSLSLSRPLILLPQPPRHSSVVLNILIGGLGGANLTPERSTE